MTGRPTLALAALAALLAGAVHAQSAPCADEPDGWRLRACLRAVHAPASLLSAESVGRVLFETVEVRVRYDSTLVLDSTFVAADSSWTAEERWEIETTRYVPALDGGQETPPGSAPPDWTVYTPEVVATPRAHRIGTPSPADALPPPAGAHADLHAAWPSASGGPPRPSRRGDVARGALYARAVYPLHVEAAGEWPASAHARGPALDALLADHEADPPDDDERARHDRAAAVQGNANPFVLDADLARRAFPQRPAVDRTAPPLWLNEVHATNDGRDTGEGVEVAGPARTDLAGWRLVLYGGRGRPYDPYDDEVSATPALSGALPTEGSLGAAWLSVRGMWNRCNGVALFDPDAVLVQFLSYGGCRFNAAAGPVADAAEAVAPGASNPAHPDSLAWTTPTLDRHGRALQEWTQMPAGTSLQLTGAGLDAADFTWTLAPATPGRLSDHQAPGSAARTTSATAAAVCPGLDGADALGCVAQGYRPARLLSLADSKDRLYDTVDRTDLDGTPGVVGLYSGLFVPFDCDPLVRPVPGRLQRGRRARREPGARLAPVPRRRRERRRARPPPPLPHAVRRELGPEQPPLRRGRGQPGLGVVSRPRHPVLPAPRPRRLRANGTAAPRGSPASRPKVTWPAPCSTWPPSTLTSSTWRGSSPSARRSSPGTPQTRPPLGTTPGPTASPGSRPGAPPARA